MAFLASLFVLSFVFPFIFWPIVGLLGVFTFIFWADFFYLFIKKQKIVCQRIVPEILPLGDNTTVELQILNLTGFTIYSKIIDELPIQFQKRDFNVRLALKNKERKEISYPIRPTKRGIYKFGDIHIFVSSIIGLIEKRHSFALTKNVAVYPSILQMKQQELKLQKKLFLFTGIKKLRRIGHSYEFEQIRNYQIGDDIRCINWKATSKRNTLMVNQFGDEKSQQIYSVLDMSRVMLMPFNGLSLLDYAVNSSLVIANTALIKYDKAGIISFSEKFGSIVKADSKPTQLKTILETLYRVEESSLEANYEILYQAIKQFINQRSLIILYTNFESYYSLERVLPIFRKINQMNLLMVVFFKNTEIADYSYQAAVDTEDIYQKTIGKKFLMDKEKIAKELSMHGIQCLLTAPEDLSTNTLNKYLEFKAKGWI